MEADLEELETLDLSDVKNEEYEKGSDNDED